MAASHRGSNVLWLDRWTGTKAERGYLMGRRLQRIFWLSLRRCLLLSAQAAWDALNKQNRYAIYFRLTALKTPAGRRKRIAAFVDILARGDMPLPQKKVPPRVICSAYFRPFDTVLTRFWMFLVLVERGAERSSQYALRLCMLGGRKRNHYLELKYLHFTLLVLPQLATLGNTAKGVQNIPTSEAIQALSLQTTPAPEIRRFDSLVKLASVFNPYMARPGGKKGKRSLRRAREPRYLVLSLKNIVLLFTLADFSDSVDIFLIPSLVSNQNIEIFFWKMRSAFGVTTGRPRGLSLAAETPDTYTGSLGALCSLGPTLYARPTDTLYNLDRTEHRIVSEHHRKQLTMEDFKRRPGACVCPSMAVEDNEFVLTAFSCKVRTDAFSILPGTRVDQVHVKLTQQKCTYLPSKKRGRRPKCLQPSIIASTDTSDEWWKLPITPSSPPDTSTSRLATSSDLFSEVTERWISLESNPDGGAIDIAGQDWFNFLATPNQLLSEPAEVKISRQTRQSKPYPSVCRVQLSTTCLLLPRCIADISALIWARQSKALWQAGPPLTITDQRLCQETPWPYARCPRKLLKLSLTAAFYSLLHSALQVRNIVMGNINIALSKHFSRGARCMNLTKLLKMTKEVFQDRNCHAEKIITVHSAIASGIILKQTNDDGQERRATALAHYRHALSYIAQLQCDKKSMSAFKVSFSSTRLLCLRTDHIGHCALGRAHRCARYSRLLVAAIHLSPSDVDQLLDNASSRAQSREFHLCPSTSIGTSNDTDQEELRNSFWLLYTIEKPTRMERETAIEVPKNLIRPSDDTDREFLIHVRLAQLCSRMLGKLYSKAACNLAHDALAEEIQLVIASATEWIEDARAIQPNDKSVLSCRTTWTWYLLLLYIFNRSLALPSDSVARQTVELMVSTYTSEILETVSEDTSNGIGPPRQLHSAFPPRFNSDSWASRWDFLQDWTRTRKFCGLVQPKVHPRDHRAVACQPPVHNLLHCQGGEQKSQTTLALCPWERSELPSSPRFNRKQLTWLSENNGT
ncbi:uncharacterized protein MYCFIDRAFT_173538 [Pseudocercospora fijiensis CIRAD86]|uniref:Uncharacterized protein n=1 Tax=Pseudocercospora fijiensis (strain CIRAD86) TaxID=383855 RepID=M3B5D8_PSEFD|nr:uncharacterized protein MYCFIDRAFT_173538 [Pseudocercospora fijiensis CIRAD86]EME84577.1 hypothetical protein MYCFIDRAFT_173538 [Pseudocercospora fijiensis CIRAD86]